MKGRIPIRLLCILSFLVVFFSSAFIQAADSQTSASPNATLDFANGLYARKMYGPAISEYEKFIQAHPDSPERASALFRAADSRYFTKNYRGAIEYFGSFIQTFPGDKRVPMAKLRMGTAWYHSKNYRAAVSTFLRLAGDRDNDRTVRGGALYYLAKSFDAMGRLDRSVQVLQKLLKIYPESQYAAYAGLAMGDSYWKSKKYPEALKAYEVAAQSKNPFEIAEEARFKMAEIYFLLKDYKSAGKQYQSIFFEDESKETPSETESLQKKRDALKDKALLGLFYCDYYNQKPDFALRRYEDNKERVGRSAYGAKMLYLTASLLVENKDYANTVKFLDEALAHPSVSEELKEEIMMKKASVLFSQGKKEVSLDELKKILNTPAANRPKLYLELAKTLRGMNRAEEALTYYQNLLQEHADTEYAKEALYQLSLLCLEVKDPQAAYDNFTLYLDRFPKDEAAPRALLQMTQIDLDYKRFKEATQNAKRFLKDYPDSEYLDIAYYKWGVAMTGLKNFVEAREAFQKITSSFPDSQLFPEALYGTAASFENNSKQQEALPYYERLVKEYPTHALSREVLQRLGYLYIQTKNYEKMSTLYQDILFNKADIKIDMDSIFWLNQYLLDKGDYETLQKVLKALPDHFSDQDLTHEINFFLGESSMGLKDYPKTVEYYTQSIEAKKDGQYAAHAYLGLGVANLALNQDKAAEDSFNSALAFDHELKVTMRARFEIANIRLKEGNLPEAAKAFMLVAILYDDPKYAPLALYKAGECFTKLNKPEEAANAFGELKNRYPDSASAKKLTEKEGTTAKNV